MIRPKDRFGEEKQATKADEPRMKKGASDNRTSAEAKGKHVSLRRFLWYFLKLGTIGFGGPVALG